MKNEWRVSCIMFLIWHIKIMQLINPTPIWATMQNKKANMILMLKWNMTTSIYWDINISILKMPHYSFVFLCIDLPRLCQPPCYIVGTEDAWVQTLCNKTFKPTIVLPAREHTRTHTPIASLRTSGSLRRVPPLLSAPPPPSPAHRRAVEWMFWWTKIRCRKGT